MEDRKQTPQQVYKKKHVKRYFLECVDTTESDIIERLESAERYSTYIKKLIREDIQRTKNNPK